MPERVERQHLGLALGEEELSAHFLSTVPHGLPAHAGKVYIGVEPHEFAEHAVVGDA